MHNIGAQFSHIRGYAATPGGTDIGLVAGLRAGDEQCYQELLVRIKRAVVPLAPAASVGIHDMDDLVQNVALKVFLRIGTFRGDSSLGTWIYRIAVNESHNSRRWHTRHRWREMSGSDMAVPSNVWADILADSTVSPFFWAQEQQRREQFTAALQKISPACRAAVTLRVIDELSYADIARRLNISVESVKSRIFSARQQLRLELADTLRPS